MKKLLIAALVLAALVVLLWRGHQPSTLPHPLASVPIIRKHVPEPHKHVSEVPGFPEHQPLHSHHSPRY